MQSKKIKHKKIKNTGLLYEFLIRQVTSDVLKGKTPSSLNLIKKYFNEKSALREELELYNILLNKKVKDSNFAFKIIETVLSGKNSINKERLHRDKYNLLREIKQKYDIDTFFKTSINNYPIYASIYTILEHSEQDGLDTYLQHKLNVANFLMETPKAGIQNNSNSVEKIDPALRSLTLKIMAEKFNEKWSALNENQKEILRFFIHNTIDSPESISFISEQAALIESELQRYIKKIDDTVLKIKLTEVKNTVPLLLKNTFINESHYLSLVRLQELLTELEKIQK